jgi:predicted kinase
LPQQAHSLLRIDGHHRGASWMMDHLQLGPIAIRQHDLVGGDRNNATAELESLFFRFHGVSVGAEPDVARGLKSGTLTQVRQAHLILITGLPGTGKSTLARTLALHFGVPLICKDTIKEPLLDVIGAADRAESRRLSDASFAVMFALARDLLHAGVDLILEGNFRPGQHEPELLAWIPPVVENVHVTQVLCRASEPVRIARLTARAADPSRHAGHRDADLAVDQSPTPVDFLALPGERMMFDSDAASAQTQSLLEAIEQRRRAPLDV